MSYNFLKLLKPVASPSHNGFDLSQKHVYSSKAGQDVPCLAIETVPDDKFTIDMAGLMRTLTFNTAAFVRGRFSFDFFFVPYSQLWHPFNQFITRRDDKHSTRQMSHYVCPTLELRCILKFIANEAISYDNGYPVMVNIHGLPVYADAIRLLDMLGYGDFRFIADIAIEQANYNTIVQKAVDDFAGQYVNIFRLAAYQHVWYDFYRNKYYDVDNTGGTPSVASSVYSREYLSFFNFDDVTCSMFADSHFIEASDIDVQDQSVNLSNAAYRRLAGLLTLRFSQYRKDLFTAALPSQQFGAVSSVDISQAGYFKFNPDGLSVNIPSGNDRYFPVDVPSYSHVSAINNSSSTTGLTGSWSMPSSFDVLQLRKAEALQAWKQNTLRAGNQVNDAFLAHYGKTSYYEEKNEVHYLGSFESRLDVNTVTAQSAAATSLDNHSVGDLAATGSSVVNGSKISFNPSDFGVILCVSHFVPDVEYRANMIDKANRLYEEFDFWTEEFQNIGLDGVAMVDYDNTQGTAFANDVLGYAPKYWQYKTAIDKCHGEFNNGGFRHWVAPRVQNAVNSNAVPIKNFYVDPSYLDDVFGVRADFSQSTDTFLHNVFFDVKAIRPMSELGLPMF